MEEEKYTNICERLARIEALLEQNAKDNKEIESTLKDHEKRIQICENSETKKDASKWNVAIDYIFKFCIVGVCGLIATKIGLK